MSLVCWQNPYKNKGKYALKGNLHTHSSPASPCGEAPLEEMLSSYESKGFDFLAFTDHNLLNYSSERTSSLVLLPGTEIDFSGRSHICLVHTDPAEIYLKKIKNPQTLIDENSKRGAIVVLNHPDWQVVEHYDMKTLLELKGYSGIEIYNEVINRLQGSPLSTAKWDRLLYSGRKILGFINHDSHNLADITDAGIVVFTGGKSKKEIFHAIKRGSFYCYRGVVIEDTGREKNKVFITTKNARLIRFIGSGGKVLKKIAGPSGEIDFEKDSSFDYIRIECLGTGEKISWTQPFFRK